MCVLFCSFIYLIIWLASLSSDKSLVDYRPAYPKDYRLYYPIFLQRIVVAYGKYTQ